MTDDIQPSKQGVCVLTGYGIAISVERGQLLISDGIARERRQGRFPRIHRIKRIITIGHSGFITFEAARWLIDTGISFAQFDYDSTVLLCLSSAHYESVALRRSQAIAPWSGVGNDSLRYSALIRLGQRVPHQSHWAALARLIGELPDEGRVDIPAPGADTSPSQEPSGDAELPSEG